MKTYVVLGALLACAQSVRADQLDSTLSQGIYEVSHSVSGKVVGGVAILTVQRVFANPGQQPDEAQLSIDLPPGAAATGLRIRAHSVWYDADLMEASKAAELYQKLTGHGPFKPKDPALLSWQWADKLHLQIFPVMPGGVSTVEYTLTTATHYRNGSYVLSYPRAGEAGLVPPVLRLGVPADPQFPVVVDGHPVASDVPVVIGPRPAPEWAGEGEPDNTASYVSSALEVTASATPKTAEVSFEIDHTYRSDLEVELVTPAGKHLVLVDRKGGDANGLRGKYPVTLPAGTQTKGTWHLLVSDHVALDTGTLESWGLKFDRGGGKSFSELAADTPRFVPDAPESADDGGLVEVRVPAPRIDLMAGRLGRVQASKTHGFARIEIDVAPRLSELPKKAQVVFVLDASKSIEQSGIDAELTMARAYLAHVPDAEVEVVLYRRFAKRLFGEFVPASGFAARLDKARAAGLLAPGNGSALDAGALLAVTALTGRHGPPRIVIASDNLLRDAFSNALAIRALAVAPAGTIVHLVIPSSGSDVEMRRNDQHVLAEIAKPSGGILVELEGLDHPLKEIQPVVLGLVRPVRLDHVALTGVSLADATPLPEVLPEGADYRTMIKTASPPTKVVVTGQLWSKPVTHTISNDPSFDRSTAAFVFSEDDYHDLSNEEMLKVAFLGRAVSPVTSYLAVEPGTRPSTIGLRGHGSGSGSGGSADYGYGMGRGDLRKKPDMLALLRPGVNRCLAANPAPAGFQQAITVETTYREVVDVLAPGSGALHDCIVEVAWALDLGAEYSVPHDHFSVEVP